MQVIVLGMHRSGTSVLSRILNLMGLYMGPEGMSTGANPENPKGFWERRDVRFLNDAVLHSLGCDWNRVLKLDLSALSTEMAEAFDEVARRTVLEMDAHRPWFTKEPRLCLLLPLWRRHLEVPVVVNVYRDPVEVAASMQRRNGIPMEAGLELWEYYVRSAARASTGLPSINVLHGDLMAGPAAVAADLHQELVRLGLRGIRDATQRELAAFIDEGLYRQRRDREDLRAYRDSRQALLFQRLQAGDSNALLDEWPGAWLELQAYEQGLPGVPEAPPPRKVRASGYDAFMLDERLKSGVRAVERLEARMNERLEKRFLGLERKMKIEARTGGEDSEASLEARLEEAVAKQKRAEQELEQRYAELAAAAREVAAAQARANECETELAKRTAERVGAGSKLEKIERQRDEDKTRMSLLERELAQKEEQLAKHRRERRRLLQAVEDQRQLREAAEVEIQRMLSSRSWRLSAPIRALARRLRGTRE